ncbi:MAG: ribosomal protein S18-alanine N-acetyltransferase [Sulfolobales archaeon]
MSAAVIREAKIEDIRYIVDIEKRSFKYPYPALAFITLMKLYPKYFLVCEYRGNVIGYVSAAIDRDGSGHIISIAVDPEYRGRGVGRLLMEAVESKCSKDGINRFKLEVAVSNLVAIKMYSSLGYRVSGVMKNYYPDGEDAYLMIKDLIRS